MEQIKKYSPQTFFVLTLLVALASLFGFADYQLSANQNEIILVVVSVVGLLVKQFEAKG